MIIMNLVSFHSIKKYKLHICQEILTNDNGCQPCPKGTKKEGVFCIPCPPGQYQNIERQETCETCSAGTFSAASASPSCTICSAGTYSDSGATKCTECEKGKYSDEEGASSCKDCNETKLEYTSVKGSTFCHSCPGLVSQVKGYPSLHTLSLQNTISITLHEVEIEHKLDNTYKFFK